MGLTTRLRAFRDGFVEGYNREHARLSAIAGDSPAEDAGETDSEIDQVSEGFVFEVTERALDRFLSQLDALDTILVGLLAATLAIAGLVVDRYEDLGDGLFWLLAAYLVSALSLSVGNLFARPLDAPNPIGAIIGVAVKGEEAIAELTAEMARNWRESQWLRRVKAGAAAAALVLLTVGTVVSIHEKVVNSRNEAGKHRATVGARGLDRRGQELPGNVRNPGF